MYPDGGNVHIWYWSVSIPNQYSGRFQKKKINTYFKQFINNPFPRFIIKSFKSDVYIFLINAYIFYTYIHFHEWEW